MCNMIESYWLIRGKFMKLLYKLKAFTLAEVMITLTIIGVISAIVVPVAFQSRPDEAVMKFKKAHNTLYQVINTLVTSDKYYQDGDLGTKADGIQTNAGDETRMYFCNTIADLLSTKSVNCQTEMIGGYGYWQASDETAHDYATGEKMKRTVTPQTILATKNKFDYDCKAGISIGSEIITTDDITYYQSSTGIAFGSERVAPNEQNGLSEAIKLRFFSPPGEFPANYSDEQGNDISYKIYCIDIDGIPDNATEDDCVNECPFGYGIRADGKIMNGKRADEWLEKDIQMEN